MQVHCRFWTCILQVARCEMVKKVKRRSDCPISLALDIFGDKWSLLIIRDLMFLKKQTYSEFLISEEKISTNILADRLARLENAGLIRKFRNLYSLTEKGIDLVPVMLEVVRWSADNVKKNAAPKGIVDRIKKDRQNFESEIVGELKRLV